ncbi:metallo-beta-lactamase superfamily hydrolase [Paludibacter propionicigenes WB4]|uniref:Metallo-beta-lactamase superfamily hydrolase n=1 Tax=Paludibacter propionicigenes (strain DSM 17365 / JCM 13257 / WB4) TaxID=694427 RepID=E4T2Z1_PALPW|nr:MBL fold metallo-hydrolase [Paludibacter propionicigenes]ADQ79085.1 metallo-beta-lactamase superfamily hydrolase [Paludibacter propionicigenes WB4]
MDKLRFQSFGSGSSGNCYFIGNASNGLLIDAGLGVRSIRKNLRNMGLDFENIWGVFVTHDHADHIKAVGPIGEKHRVPIYTTRKVHEGIQRSYCVTEKLYSSRKYIEKNETIEVGEFKVTAFPVSHDATDNVGYTVEYKEKRFTFATDLGFVSEEVAEHLSKSDYMVLEANYDEQMLMQGSYPAYLKNRIIAKTGHLSNDQAGLFLSEAYNERIKHIFLCHLSRENNLPELAYTTIQNYLETKKVKVGVDVQLVTLDRMNISELYIF